MTTGQRIAAARKNRGLTQKQLAETLGVSDKAISRWERNESEPDIQSLLGLSSVLGVSVDFLLTGRETSAKSDQETSTQPISTLRPIMLVVFGTVLSLLFATVIDPIIPGSNWGYLPFLLCAFLSIWLLLAQQITVTPKSIQQMIQFSIILISLAMFTLPAAFSTEIFSIIGLGVLLAEAGFVLSTGAAWFLVTPVLKKHNLLPEKPNLKQLRRTTTVLYILAMMVCFYMSQAAGFYQEIYMVAFAYLTIPITVLTILIYRKAK